MNDSFLVRGKRLLSIVVIFSLGDVYKIDGKEEENLENGC